MSYETLIANFGFSQDPFASWDADTEDNLEDYFIEPPFFNAVFGEPSRPIVSVVFAPRGGGKSALRRKIELSSASQSILAISYTTFPTAQVKLADVDIEYHLKRIIVLILVGIVASLATDNRHIKLKSDSRKVLYWLIKEHLSDVQQADLRSTVLAVRTMSQAGVEWWNDAIKFINPLVYTATAVLGASAPELTLFSTDRPELGPLSDQLSLLGLITKEISVQSILILIDRVDENDLTGNDASKAFTFIAPLLKNLNILQIKNIGFKFFLWDRLRPSFRDECRADRIQTYDLEWTHEQIKDLLSERLRFYSDQRVVSFSSITDVTGKQNVDDLIAFLSQGSPRNAIRLCKEILIQQSEIDATSDRVSEAAFVNGINIFAKKRAEETVPDAILRDLQKVGRLDFTVLYLYRSVFKVTQQAGLQKIQSWGAKGIVTQVGTQKSDGGSKSNHYAIADPIVGKFISGFPDIFEFVKEKVRTCPRCRTFNVRDWDISCVQACRTCQRDLDSQTEGHIP